jgi:hypothetical protein
VSRPSPTGASRPHPAGRTIAGLAAAWVFAGALYLLLIDITQLPELLVGAGVATIAAIGTELTRAQGIVGEGLRLRWLVRAHRPLLQLPADVVRVSVAAIAQLFSRKAQRGAFRAVPFHCGADKQTLETGRYGLAEALGSFAPNTIVVGVDTERELILGHQLRRTGGREAIDMLELG